ncbi:tRNA (adenosine(37)-N6)-threonylcarbamoyltransferase complex ATPase subunit type 1 TsaE [Campylobacter curvus]|uniref:tRNA (adenosine(37)-N6)-threonylcarbamoyltransferase complex ATPase subunit type 1 TsaE n=1 Tax=Campylobacter curvus TaxID=200 RepID=UPI0014706A01|nr:tRNA (adenosine(37)-N6)-threonylcarbamoyltransferase complex ATPase subunit type 1 TsaE [Campylobacter curvus]
MKRIFNLNLNDLDELVGILPKSGVIILQGDLASGKTTLVKAIVKAHGIDADVTSPTFSVMQSYGDKIFHYDIYQSGFEGILKNGLFENLLEDGLHLVEWGDESLEKMLAKFGEKYVKIIISPSANGRKYEVYGA